MFAGHKLCHVIADGTVQQRGRDEPGANRIDSNTHLPVFDGGAFGQARDGVLAGRVEAGMGVGGQAQGRGHIDDAALALRLHVP